MAKFRSIQTTFWSDSKIVDDFEPEDRYFYLYLLTNEKSNQLGCYELSKKQMCRDTGYDQKTVENLLEKLEKELEVIYYDNKTKEILIINWHKYNWLNSWKTKTCIDKEYLQVKSQKIIDILCPLYAPYMPLPSNNKNNNNNNKNNNNNNNNNKKNNKGILSGDADDTPSDLSQIMKCLNGIGEQDDSFKKNKIKFEYKTNQTNIKLIESLLSKGHTKQEIFDVIYLKYDQWVENNDKNKTDMSTFYRPSTIFGDKFEEYLQEAKRKEIS